MKQHNYFRFKMKKNGFSSSRLANVSATSIGTQSLDLSDERNASPEALGLITQTPEENFCERVFSELSDC